MAGLLHGSTRLDPAIHEDVPQIMVDHITRLYGWFCAIDWKPEAITAAATVLLAFLTLTLAGGTIGLWFATRRLVRGAENTAERQLRAYIFVSDSSRLGGPSPAPEFRIVVKNFGQTPARNGTYWVSSKIDKYNSTAGFDRPKDAGTGRFKSGPFHVSTVTGINVEPGKLRLEGDRLTDFREGKIAFFVFGELNYTDVFDKYKITKFRLMYTIGGEPHGKLSNSEEGNKST